MNESLSESEGLEEARRRTRSIFQFLEAINSRRNPPQRHIDAQPWKAWLNDLPDHPSISISQVVEEASSIDDDEGLDETTAIQPRSLISVTRPVLTQPPTPPDPLIDWLLRGWEDPDREAEVRESLNEMNESGETEVVRFADDPERPLLLTDWVALRSEWARGERPAREAMKSFERFYDLWSQIEREAEAVELVLGEGILTWDLGEGSVRHPILLQRVDLKFDPLTAEFSVVETDSVPELYSSLLQAIDEIDAAHIGTIRSELEAGGFHPLGSDETSGFLKAAIVRFSARGRFVDESEAAPVGDAPWIRRSPVLFLRKRSLGFATCIREIIDDLETADDLPESIIRIAGIDSDSGMRSGTAAVEAARTSKSADDILFCLPANPEQIRIAQRLESERAVLVQGPPGTGKTHTIANLIGNLLADGKSVLVTSHTTKALRVLRDKVTPELQPLCISVLESDEEGRRQLQASVSAIAERLTQTDAKQSFALAESLRGERDSLLKTIRENTRRLVAAREGEYRPIVVAGESFMPSEASRWVVANREEHGWIPAPVQLGAPMPLSEQEVRRLYATSLDLSREEEQQIDELVPDPSELPSEEAFASLVHARNELRGFPRNPDPRYWGDSDPSCSIEAIDSALSAVRRAIEILPLSEAWKMEVALAGVRGEAFTRHWERMNAEIASLRDESAAAQVVLLEHAPEPSADLPLDEQSQCAAGLRDHVHAGKSLSAFRLALKSEWRAFLKEARVAAGMPSTAEHFDALKTAIDLAIARRDLARKWDHLVAPHGGPSASSFGEQIEHPLTQASASIRRWLDWHRDVWQPGHAALSESGFDWNALDEAFPVQEGASTELERLIALVGSPLTNAAQPMVNLLRWAEYEQLAKDWRQRVQRHITRSGMTSAAVAALKQAVDSLSVEAYRPAIAQIRRLWSLRELRGERRQLLSKLTRSAPSWANAVSSRTPPHGSELPGNPAKAWQWCQLQSELKARWETSIPDLEREIESAKDQLRTVTSRLISCRAWAEQAQRTSLVQRQALIGWLDAIRRLGKYGTVKRAASLKRQAQQNLKIARTSVPVWIMPIARVAESFSPTSEKFDVAIIDEASQCDLTALIVLYLAKRVIIVGDHEQVSPSAVGEEQAVIERLQAQYLAGVPNRALYDSRLSIYDLARSSFGEAICLVEHFRCVPDIISFSNHLAYDGRIKPLREASSSILNPGLVPHRVEASAVDGKLNRDEAAIVASLLVAACEQTEYADASFGVISMVGEETAFEIDVLLRSHLDPAEYQRRRVRAGNPSQFQGDERDVIFLSLVDAPAGGPLALRESADWRKRFNVASSRARDQLWVVHSVDPEIDLKPGDLRRRLIEHAKDPGSLSRQIDIAVAQAESPFETEVVRRLIESGYRIRPQFPVGHYRIDIVVEGAGNRLAVECDGDRYHPIEMLGEDLARQEILERLGWRFVRIRGSAFYSDPDKAMEPLFEKLRALGIEPTGAEAPSELPDADGDLVERVIRRAAEIRSEWEVEATDPNGAPFSSPARPSRNWRLATASVAPGEVDRASEEILSLLARHGAPLARADVLRMTGISEAQWQAGISALKRSGRIQAVGVKRGAKWQIVDGASAIGDGRANELVVSTMEILNPIDGTQTGLALSRDLGSASSNAGRLTELQKRFDFGVVDGRSKADPLYVVADDGDPELARALRSLGFNYNKTAKRWWTRDQSIS